MPTQSRGHGTRFLIGLLCVAFLTGCNRGPQFGEVVGTVTLNGRPLSDLEVVFMPDPEAGTSGPASSAYTNEKGQYHLVTAKGQRGAIVGTHRVCIRDLAALPLAPMLDAEGNPERARGPRPAPKPSRVPSAYTSSHETPLRAVEVKPGEQTHNFELAAAKRRDTPPN